MKFSYITLLALTMSGPTFAASTPFVLEKKIAFPYSICSDTANEGRVQVAKDGLTQDARLKCNTNVTQVAPFKILQNECGLEVGHGQLSIVRIQSEFVCNTPQEKIIGIGYKVEQGGVVNDGPSFFEIADSDAVGQCGSDVVRVSKYSYDGQDSFTRVYYKYGRVRFMTSAEYECAHK